MSTTDDELKRLAYAYADEGWAIAWTKPREKDAKAPQHHSRAKPEQGEFLFGVMRERLDRKNCGISLERSEPPVIAFDDDSNGQALPDWWDQLPPTVTAISARGERPIYKSPARHGLKIEIGKDGKVSIARGDTFVIVPPSRRAEGDLAPDWEWKPGHAPGEIAVAELPLELLQRIEGTRAGAQSFHIPAAGEDQGDIPEGKRNNTLFRLACRIARVCNSSEVVLGAIRAENAARCVPPLEEFELAKIARSARESVRKVPGHVPQVMGEPDDQELEEGPSFVDWDAFWSGDHAGEDWLLEGMIARARSHVVYAPHGVGKSLWMLWASLELLELGVVVIYLDYEMSEADLLDRLDDMGRGPGSDLSLLHYWLIPNLDPLDTESGGQQLLQAVEQVADQHPGRELMLVIDTVSRATKGDENENDTFRDFYRCTGMGLKRRGIGWIRLDHAGKDLSRGQRGASGKGDDPDVVWRLAETDDGIELHRDKGRMGWVPEKVTLRREEDPALRYVSAPRAYPSGTKECANDLDDLGVPLNASTRPAQTALRDVGRGKRAQVVRAALWWRRDHRDPPRDPPLGVPLGPTSGPTYPKSHSHGADPPPDPPGPTPGALMGPTGSPYGGPGDPGPVSEGFQEDDSGRVEQACKECYRPAGHPHTDACSSSGAVEVDR